jgi:DNA repair protein RadC
MQLRELPTHQRPRERLLRHGATALPDVELLTLVLGTAGPAQALAAEFTDLRRLAAAGIGELSSIAGVGFAQACRIKAALALAGRLGERPVARGHPLRGPAHAMELLAPRLSVLDHEVFVVLALDVKLRVLAEMDLAVGGAAGVSVTPRDVFTALVRERAEAVIFAHNHPSGDPEPSLDDHVLTDKLREIGELVGIRVVDHLILAQAGRFSFAESVWNARK